MLKIEDANRILNILTDPWWPTNREAGYGITGYEVHDDGEDCDPDKRYWGEVFVEGISAEAAMGPTMQGVYNDLALAAVRIAAGRENITVIEVIDGGRKTYSSEDVFLGVIEVCGKADGSPEAYRVIPKPMSELPEELKELAEASVGPQKLHR